MIDKNPEDQLDEDIESHLDKAMAEQDQIKRLVDLFMLALLLIFAMYSFF
jgi:hypothetical protein